MRKQLKSNHKDTSLIWGRDHILTFFFGSGSHHLSSLSTNTSKSNRGKLKKLLGFAILQLAETHTRLVLFLSISISRLIAGPFPN